jgi:large subunit ribosomal protein L17
MRHLKSGRKLNRTASHRKAMFANMAMSIMEHERIKTTLPKAKEVRSLVERLITYGKKGDLHGIRLIAKKVNNKDLVMKIVNDIAVGYKDRDGGYTRILKLGPRKGDSTEMAIIELVDRKAVEAIEVDGDE